ncbi:hypothetical protein KZ843_06830 [Pseudomonas aeruginosa]|nr:hypothetical protein [Pseudomonas aeruginosa]MBW6122607.1 hypothetical protein [Pseudomonas aeruginosa]
MFTYIIDPEGHDVDGQLLPAVTLCCGNCATLHDLADNAREESPKRKPVRPAAGYPRDSGVPSLAGKEAKRRDSEELQSAMPSSVEREGIIRELLSSESISASTAAGVADKFGEFAEHLAAKGLSKKVLFEHTRNLLVLASEIAHYASVTAPEHEPIDTGAKEVLLEVVAEHGMQTSSSLTAPVRASLDRTCRRLYRWLQN